MKDVTSTSFGLMIAFFLPGISCIYSLNFWFPEIEQLFRKFLTAESNVGLFLLICMASIIASLQITIVRWVIFERLLCRKHILDHCYFEKLGSNENKLSAFRAAVDEHYRYHQFWGGMTLVIPIFVGGVIHNKLTNLSLFEIIIWCALFLFCEILTGIAAYEAFINYVKRAEYILV